MSSQFVQNSLSKLSSRVFTIRLKLTFQVVFACFTMKLISLLLPFVLLIGFLSGVQAKNARANIPTLEEPQGEQAVQQITAVLTIGAILLGMAYQIRDQRVGRKMVINPWSAGIVAAMRLAPGQVTTDVLQVFGDAYQALKYSLFIYNGSTMSALVLSVWNDLVRDLLNEGVAIGTIHAIRQYMEGYLEAGPYSTVPFPHFSYIVPPSDDEDERDLYPVNGFPHEDEDEDEDDEDDDEELIVLILESN